MMAKKFKSKKVLLFFLLFLGVSVTCCTLYCLNQSYQKNIHDRNAAEAPISVDYVDVSSLMNNKTPIHLEASYSDGSETFEEVKSKAAVIIQGVVVKQEQFSPVSVRSYVKVDRTLAGQASENILVYQLGAIGYEEVLNPKKEYLLLLNYQKNPSSNEFYIIGGIQGMLEVTDKEIISLDPLIQSSLSLYNNKSKPLDSIVSSILK